jgi:hypothetical protein
MTLADPAPPGPLLDPADPKHVLLFDNGPEFLAYTRLRPQDRGYAVTTINPTRRTFAMVAALAPDAVVCGLGAGGDPPWRWRSGWRATRRRVPR